MATGLRADAGRGSPRSGGSPPSTGVGPKHGGRGAPAERPRTARARPPARVPGGLSPGVVGARRRAPPSTRPTRAGSHARQWPRSSPRAVERGQRRVGDPPRLVGSGARLGLRAARARARPGARAASARVAAPPAIAWCEDARGVGEPAGLEQRAAEPRQQRRTRRLFPRQERRRTLEQAGAGGRVAAQQRASPPRRERPTPPRPARAGAAGAPELGAGSGRPRSRWWPTISSWARGRASSQRRRARAARRAAAWAGPSYAASRIERVREAEGVLPGSSGRSARTSCLLHQREEVRGPSAAPSSGERRERAARGSVRPSTEACAQEPPLPGLEAVDARGEHRLQARRQRRRPAARRRRPRAARGRAGCPRPRSTIRSAVPASSLRRVLDEQRCAVARPGAPRARASTGSGCGAAHAGRRLEQLGAARGRRAAAARRSRTRRTYSSRSSRRRLGPVDVLDDDHERALARDALEQPAHRPGRSPRPAPRRRRARSRRAACGDAAPPRRRRAHAAGPAPPASRPTISASGR